MNKGEVMIRSGTATDASSLARLTTELGYPVSEESIATRLTRILGSPRDCLLVAVDESGAVVGWIHGFQSQLLESDFRVEIGGLIVDPRCRRRGIGRCLVQRLEQWAIEESVPELGVRCREERVESHQFYESLGLVRTKTQRVFRKRLSTRPEVNALKKP